MRGVPRVAHVATVDLTLRFLLLPQLQALRDAGFEVTTISAPGPWVADLEAQGIRHIPWPAVTRAWDPRSDARAFGQLFAILRHERFDVVHTHNPKPGVMGRIAARMASGSGVMNTVHGLYATPEDRLLRRAPVLAAEWIAARCSDIELYQSAEDLEWAKRLRLVRRSRSIHLGNGVDLSEFTPELRAEERIRKLRAELGIGEDELIVGTVGRMVLEKGYGELFQAARAVRARIPNARFLVVGDRDTLKSDSVPAVSIEDAGDDFVFAGWREDVADLMALMDVFVLPSWREGLPRSAIEAAASGLPLVLTDIRGCREVVRDGVEGFLVPVRDPRRLADAIGLLLDDAGLRRRMGDAARARAEERFDEQRVARIVVGATRMLLDGPEPPPWEKDGGGVRVRTAHPEDVAAMATLHRLSMPTAFLPTLGDGFLRQLYRAMVGDADAVALVAEDQAHVVGFATGVTSVGDFYRRFALRRGLAAALAAAPHVLRRSTRRRAIETWRHQAGCDRLPEAELLSIAVERSHRSAGVGGALADAVTRRLIDKGVQEFKVVVGAENTGANRLYERLGFRLAGTTAVHQGIASNVWVRSCPS